MRFIEHNPVDHTKIPRTIRSVDKADDAKALSLDARQQILMAAFNDSLYKPIIFTLMFTGMRAGEFLALPWKNVDLQQGVITIDRAVTLDTEMDDTLSSKSRTSVVSSTKTYASNRKIKIPRVLTDILLEWRQHQSANKKYHHLIDQESVVFPNQYGQMRTYNGFRTTYRRFMDKHGFTAYGANIHSYRHTFATMLLEAGVNPRIVQKLLGHKDISTTLNTYCHVLSEVYQGVAETLNEVCSSTISGTFTPIVGSAKVAQITGSIFEEA
jgi:integrase